MCRMPDSFGRLFADDTVTSDKKIMKTKLLPFCSPAAIIAAMAVACTEPATTNGETPPPPMEYNITVNATTGGTAYATIGGWVVQQSFEGMNITLTATADEGYAFAGWTAATAGVTFADPTAAITTFIMPASYVAITAEFVTEPRPHKGVQINGIRWAECNVNSSGTFAVTSTDSGMFYQWGRKIARSATNPMVGTDGSTTWDNTDCEDEEWTAENDPCPIGWQVPDNYAFERLTDAEKVTGEWVAASGTALPAGRRFTDTATGNSIFLPACGFRVDVEGELTGVGVFGCYWSATTDRHESGYHFDFYDNAAYPIFDSRRSYGFSVRCVEE